MFMDLYPCASFTQSGWDCDCDAIDKWIPLFSVVIFTLNDANFKGTQ